MVWADVSGQVFANRSISHNIDYCDVLHRQHLLIDGMRDGMYFFTVCSLSPSGGCGKIWAKGGEKDVSDKMQVWMPVYRHGEIILGKLQIGVPELPLCSSF